MFEYPYGNCEQQSTRLFQHYWLWMYYGSVYMILHWWSHCIKTLSISMALCEASPLVQIQSFNGFFFFASLKKTTVGQTIELQWFDMPWGYNKTLNSLHTLPMVPLWTSKAMGCLLWGPGREMRYLIVNLTQFGSPLTQIMACCLMVPSH